jgi:ribosomal-protein-serine acetyltransferase
MNSSIIINENIELQPLNPGHTSILFNLIETNRNHLRPWFPWVDRMSKEEDINNFITGSLQRTEAGYEQSFIIFYKSKPAGRIGIYYIDQQNKIGGIGYWLSKECEGLGIIIASIPKLADFGFDQLGLNRIEIKCATSNKRSKAIPEKLHFTYEGILKEAEYINGRFNDLFSFSMIKSDRK